MSKIKLLSKLDLAVIEKNNGKKKMAKADHDDRGE